MPESGWAARRSLIQAGEQHRPRAHRVTVTRTMSCSAALVGTARAASAAGVLVSASLVDTR